MLLTRAALDQQVRRADIEQCAVPNEPLRRLGHRVDHQNTIWLTQVIETYGWPGASLVGVDGAHAAWLLCQHAELAFQRDTLPLLQTAVAAGEADPMHLAYLSDRLAHRAGLPQTYGTQHEWDPTAGRFLPAATTDPSRVDSRRAAIGLDPLADNTDTINEMYRVGKREADNRR